MSIHNNSLGQFICSKNSVNRESVAGSVIQDTGMVEFEDGLKKGNQSETEKRKETFRGSGLNLR